jgi:AraC-like DNA-binding protein
MRDIGDAIAGLSRLAGAPVLWRLAGHLWQHGDRSSMAEELHLHCNRFCMAVKDRPRLLSLCKGREGTELLEDVRREKKPFVKTCHAGVMELVLPIFHETRCEGALLFGPFRTPGGPCPYRRFQREYHDLPSYTEETADRVLPLLRVTAERIVSEGVKLFAERIGGARDERIQRAIQYCYDHHAERIPLAKIARHSSLSPSRFVHLFRSECGVSFTAFLTRVRMAEARRLLGTTALPIAEVGRRVGYPDQSRFGAVFKKAAGETPLRYRRRTVGLSGP